MRGRCPDFDRPIAEPGEIEMVLLLQMGLHRCIELTRTTGMCVMELRRKGGIVGCASIAFAPVMEGLPLTILPSRRRGAKRLVANTTRRRKLCRIPESKTAHGQMGGRLSVDPKMQLRAAGRPRRRAKEYAVPEM